MLKMKVRRRPSSSESGSEKSEDDKDESDESEDEQKGSEPDKEDHGDEKEKKEGEKIEAGNEANLKDAVDKTARNSILAQEFQHSSGPVVYPLGQYSPLVGVNQLKFRRDCTNARFVPNHPLYIKAWPFFFTGILVGGVSTYVSLSHQPRRPGKTNKKDWDKYERQTKSAKVPPSLLPVLKKKMELFSMWLDNDQDWDRVVMSVERSQQTSNLSRKQRVAVKVKTLKTQMSSDKYEELVKKELKPGFSTKMKFCPTMRRTAPSTLLLVWFVHRNQAIAHVCVLSWLWGGHLLSAKFHVHTQNQFQIMMFVIANKQNVKYLLLPTQSIYLYTYQKHP